ncbi:hypothetical protein [[Pantoea] beijingensis]|uniref:hypothetical protein n=1 Tax=[Pantoea] beijingensis TaxID=1324864 RepID=UPI0012B0E395|nr:MULTISPECIES: hypothetical protein [Erwiniaceae]
MSNTYAGLSSGAGAFRQQREVSQVQDVFSVRLLTPRYHDDSATNDGSGESHAA